MPRDRPVTTRFAPSPTGRLHLGHAYSAILAHDVAREEGGRFLLRIEDIDGTRSRAAFVDGIIEDLSWLGLTWDGEVWCQSRRLDVYQAALDDLRGRGLIYPCFCTRAEIAAEVAASMAAPHGPDGPVYPGTCRRLGEAERDALLESGKAHAWRLDMARALASLRRGADKGRPLIWTDHGQPIEARPEQFGDVILARKDAPASYHLAVTIDDAAQGVTDIVRGRDLFAATHVHRLLQALLDLPTPFYHHHPLITGPDGERLAKRHGAPSIAGYRERGGDPAVLCAALRDGRLPAGFSTAAS